MVSTVRSLLVVGAVACAMAFAPATGNAKQYTMKFSHSFPLKHFMAQAADRFAKAVEEKSNGQLKVEVFGAAQLYKSTQATEAIQTGAVESAYTAAVYLTPFIPLMGIFDVPTLIGSDEVCYGIFDSEIGDDLLARMEQFKLKGLGWFHYGSGDFWSVKKALITEEDWKGMKMRVNNDMLALTVKALGGSPVIMSSSDVYMALQRGTIDGMHTGASSMVGRKQFEVAKFGTNDRHNYTPLPLCCSVHRPFAP